MENEQRALHNIAWAIWMRLGAILHRLTSPVVLFVLYFGFFSPYALALRLLRPRSNFSQHDGKTVWDDAGLDDPACDFKRQF